MSLEAGNKAVASEVQSIVNSLYTARSNRGMGNSTKPSISAGASIRAADINSAITTAKGDFSGSNGWIKYSSDILAHVMAGQLMRSSEIKALQQVQQDTLYLARCSSGCYGNCISGCSNSTCTQSCTSTCRNGCNRNCGSAGCSGYCYTSCTASCFPNCKGGITIASTCKSGCGKNCTGACGSGCNNTCGGGCSSGC